MKKEVDSSIQIEDFMENGREILISDFGFRSTSNEESVYGIWGPYFPLKGNTRGGHDRPYEALDGLIHSFP